MKNLIILMLYVPLFLLSSVYLYADDGITIYSEDFSSDPHWITNNSANYYWDSTGGRYYYKIIDATNEYAYVSVHHFMDASFRSFKLTLDLLPTHTGWAGDFRLGVSNANMSYIAPTSIVGSFCVGDGGHHIHLCGTDNQSRFFDNMTGPQELFTDNVLYQLILSCDNLTLYTDLLVIKKENGDTIYAASIYGYGPFLGMDRIYMGSIGDPGYPDCYAEGYIDNVVLTVKPYNGDVNCDDKISVSDCVYLINYLFRGGPPPCQ